MLATKVSTFRLSAALAWRMDMFKGIDLWGPVYLHGLTLIPV